MSFQSVDQCPVCGGDADGCLYEPDEDREGYPQEYQICATCQAPLVVKVARRSPPRCGICGRFARKNGACVKIFYDDWNGGWEHG